MKEYKVNEIFRSVQAEGFNAGKSAVFVRFSGCNLDCKFCDTNHEPYKIMTGEQIDAEIDRLSDGNKSVLVVFTGGEPTLQLSEDEPLGSDHPTAMESNGILNAPSWIQWVTISPKTKLTTQQLRRANEVKVLYGFFDDDYLISLIGIHSLLYVQPLEKNGIMNVKDCVRFITEHPEYKLSIQWHKITGVR